MAKYDFDQLIPRRGTNSVKWDEEPAADILPMWVADMDFRTAPCVVEALRRRVEHGVYGYATVPESYYGAVTSWFARRHGWAPGADWILPVTGVIPALSAILRALTRPGDRVLVLTPVYNHFFIAIDNSGCSAAECELTYGDNRYTVDFDALERRAADPAVKLMLLCNPHNPAGRVWTPEELRRIGDICLRHGVTVVADEVHADFARPGFKHVPYASLGERYARHAVVCTAPSKTFNLAGLQLSNIFIPDPDLRAAFKRARNRTGYDEPSVLGITAAQACYERGEEWLDELKKVLDGNYAVLQAAVDRMPGVSLVPLESTYLPWLDCRGLGLDDAGIKRLVEQDAKLWLDLGTMFGPEGSGFVRMNLASPKPLIEQACDRLEQAVAKLAK